MSNKADCRTAPATPGLLIILSMSNEGVCKTTAATPGLLNNRVTFFNIANKAGSAHACSCHQQL